MEELIATVHTPLRRVTIAQALAAMAQHPVRQAEAERVAISSADGRVLATDVKAVVDVPGFARSMVDGYAVRADDVATASQQHPTVLRLAGSVLMGKPASQPLARGEAIAVPTGGALPGGTTAVIKVEDTELRGRNVAIFDARDGEHRINPIASDVRQGETLFSAGKRLWAAALGLLAAAGVAHVVVYRKPTVGVLVTGDELVPVGDPLSLGQIHESNGVAVMAALCALGCTPRSYGVIADVREELDHSLREALSSCDAVIVSGGSSVGQRDYVPDVVAAAGTPGVIVHGVRAKPGRPVLLAMIGDRPVIGLPGNPVSALIMLEALARPILLRMFGVSDRPLAFRAQLESEIVADPGLEHRIPVQLLHDENGALLARPLLGSSSQLHILARADAVVIIPEASGGRAAGTMVEAFPFSAMRTS